MSGDFVINLAATLFGALSVFVTGIGSEKYRRFKERQGIASAIAGEIFSIIEITKKRKHEENFKYF